VSKNVTNLRVKPAKNQQEKKEEKKENLRNSRKKGMHRMSERESEREREREREIRRQTNERSDPNDKFITFGVCQKHFELCSVKRICDVNTLILSLFILILFTAVDFISILINISVMMKDF
jgi:hypothetical protein